MFTCTLHGLKIPKRKGENRHYEGCPANPIKQPKLGFTLNSKRADSDLEAIFQGLSDELHGQR